MTLSTTDTAISYTTDGVTTVFAVPYGFFGADELTVYLIDGTTVTTLTRGIDYNVTGGGGATGAIATTLIAAGKTLVIQRATTKTQITDLANGDPLDADAYERALDRRAMVEQDLTAALNRAIAAPSHETAGLTKLPAAASRANMLLGFDSLGQPTVYATTGGAVALTDLPTSVQQVPLPFIYEGKPTAGQARVVPLGQAYVIPANLAGLQGYFATAATSSAAFVLRVRQSGTISTHGTISINAGGTITAPVAAARTLAAGDALLFDPPAVADATLADGGFTLILNRAA